MHRTILYIKRCSCCRGIFPLIDLRWYTFLSFSRICVENSLRGRFLLFLLWADYRQEYHSFRWIIWPYSLISAGKKRCLYRRTLSEQFLLVYVKITELTIEERGNVRHWAACRAKAGGRKILQVLQVLKNTEVKGKIKTKTVSEPVAFQGQDSAFTHSKTGKIKWKNNWRICISRLTSAQVREEVFICSKDMQIPDRLFWSNSKIMNNKAFLSGWRGFQAVLWKCQRSCVSGKTRIIWGIMCFGRVHCPKWDLTKLQKNKKQDFSNTEKTCKTGKKAHVTIKQWTFWVLYRTRGGKSKAFISVWVDTPTFASGE